MYASGYTTPSYGHFTVFGAGVNQSIVFTPLVSYTITLHETGLPTGAPWSLVLRGSHSSFSGDGAAPEAFTIPDVANGTYTFTAYASGYTASPSPGNVSVHGANVSQAVSFTYSSGYAVTFTEHGLPSGALLAVFFANSTGFLEPNFNFTSVTFTVPNGAYGWSAVAPGYAASSPSGVVTVNGGPVSQTLDFAAVPTGSYLVLMFRSVATNLSNGAPWGITLGGVTQSLAGGLPVFFYEPNGSYSWSVTPPAGYLAVPASGTIGVSGSLAQSLFGNETGATVVFAFLADPAATPAGPVGSSADAASPPGAMLGLAGFLPLATVASIKGRTPSPGQA